MHVPPLSLGGPEKRNTIKIILFFPLLNKLKSILLESYLKVNFFMEGK